MKIEGSNGLVSFGKELMNFKEQLQPSNQVMTFGVLASTFPIQLNINLKEDLDLETHSLSSNLLFHYCESLHKEVTEEELKTFETMENFDQDERVFYVSDNE